MCICTFSTAAAREGGVVALTDPRVPQYNEALAAARSVVRELQVIDPNQVDAAEQLRRAEPSVILAIGQRALQLAKSATPATPTVFCMVLGPYAAASRTVTGIKLEVAPSAQLERWRQVNPGAKRVGVIYDPRTSGSFLEEALKAAGGLGLTLVARPVAGIKEVTGALSEIADSIDALWLMEDPRLLTAEMFSFMLVYTTERKIPLFGFLDSLTRAGALASVSPDYAESGRRAARMAAEVAGRPSDGRVPVPPPAASPGSLSINLKTARQLGIDVSADVLAKAQKVYR